MSDWNWQSEEPPPVALPVGLEWSRCEESGDWNVVDDYGTYRGVVRYGMALPVVVAFVDSLPEPF